jgi:hypothetical protein
MSLFRFGGFDLVVMCVGGLLELELEFRFVACLFSGWTTWCGTTRVRFVLDDFCIQVDNRFGRVICDPN